MLCDQTFFAAGINSLYLSYSTLAHGGSIQDAENKVKNNIWSVLKANWYMWPAVQMFSFRFVPIPLQMPVMNVAVLFWSCYLAIVGNRDKNKQLSSHPIDETTTTATISPTTAGTTTIPGPQSIMLASTTKPLASMFDDDGSVHYQTDQKTPRHNNLWRFAL